MRSRVLLSIFLMLLSSCAGAADAPEAKGKLGKLPHVEFDVARKVVRVECEALDTSAPLEFFVCKTGTNEYEAALRSAVTPSDLHTALLAVGLKPGSPVTFSESLKKMIPPHGPPLHITMEYQKDGKTVSSPAYRWLRDVKTKKEPKTFTWVFAGSRVMPDGKYAADVTGYIVSVVNFDLTMIDIPELASSANETLEWERNPDVAPKGGTKVSMVIEPAGKAEGGDTTSHPADAGSSPRSASPSDAPGVDASAQAAVTPAPGARPTTADAAATTEPASGLSDVHVDQVKVDRLKDYWEKKVSPHSNAMRAAAQAHYAVIADLHKEQQRLIDEADRIQRTIDDLEKQYQDMTTPHEGSGS